MTCFVAGIEITVTGNTGQAPEILIFAPRAITPTEHLESNQVSAFLDIRRDIKFSCYLGILGIANELSVHPQIDAGRDTSEMGNHLFAIPI